MARDEDDRKALGARLAAARKLATLTLDQVAAKLTEGGYKFGKAAVGAWEVGRNVPDAIVLGRLAKMYGVTADALLWDTAITIEAIRIAAQYDALKDADQRKLRAIWLAYFTEATSDEAVEASYGLPPTISIDVPMHRQENGRPADEAADDKRGSKR